MSVPSPGATQFSTVPFNSNGEPAVANTLVPFGGCRMTTTFDTTWFYGELSTQGTSVLEFNNDANRKNFDILGGASSFKSTVTGSAFTVIEMNRVVYDSCFP